MTIAPAIIQPSVINNSLQLWAEQASQNLLGAGGLGVVQSLWSYVTTSSSGFQPSQVSLVLDILGNITSNVEMAGARLSVETVYKVLSIADQLISDMSLDPSYSLAESLGPRLLWCLEKLFPVMSISNESFSLSYKNLDVRYITTSCDSIENNKILHLDATTTSISLPGDHGSDCEVKIISVTYPPKNGTFTSDYDNNGKTSFSYYLASDVRTNIVILNNQSYHLAKVNMSFTCGNDSCDQTAVCVFWDFAVAKWSSRGCLTQVTDGITQCMCDHLTSFAVLMSGHVAEDNLNDTILSYITEIGLCLSSVSLLLCILIQVVLLIHSRNIVASYRHVSTLHMSLFLLIFNISFLTPDFMKQDIPENLCVAFTFCSHFSLMGFFCWTLVQGIFLVCRLVFVFHHVTKAEFLVLSIVLGYVLPLAIAVGTFLVYFPHSYKSDSCWLDGHSGALMAFVVPIIVIMAINFLILIVVISKLLRPSISEGKSEDEEVVKKLAKAVLFCTPQFGLTWAIGIPMFAINQENLFLQYLFVLLNPLQGFFILLFTCLLDKKVMDLLKKLLLKTSVPNTTVMTTSSG
ncbi:adhesion G-protein coupled receptor F3-like [Engystomops pustulosus]|uniref:adhesion G-protein coupled receptor F3-like n=1 Tax=Engystomops pustulosus TaxID=76066 RepID=UPI003AFB7383